MKKILLIVTMLFLVIGITGCEKVKPEEEKKPTADAVLFKEEYESFNGKKNDYFEYRNVEIEEFNPIVFATDEEIVKMIEEEKSFIVYFGDPECPWCRSVVEQMIKSAKENNVEKLYYVRFWDGFHNEKIRNVMELNAKNKPVEKTKGTDSYYKLLEYLDGVLSDYTLTTKAGKTVKTGQKRIFLPNVVAVVNGEAKELIEGISEKQDSYNGELTEEVIKDEKTMFNEFFSKYNK